MVEESVGLPENLPITGVILSDHVKNLDWKIRRAEFICHSPTDVVNIVLAKLNILLV